MALAGTRDSCHRRAVVEWSSRLACMHYASAWDICDRDMMPQRVSARNQAPLDSRTTWSTIPIPALP